MMHVPRSPTLWAFGCLIIIDALFFGLTDPKKASTIVLLLGFALVIATTFTSVRVIRSYLSRFLSRLKKYKHVDGFIAGVLCISLGLSSLGQLSSRDFILLVIAAGAWYWYIGYQKRSIALRE